MTQACQNAIEQELVLCYTAPFLIDKLLKDHVVDSTEEAEVLFSEVKKYLLLASSDREKIWKMYSLRVDEVWHQFILYTREYMNFCDRFFGRYIAHSPSNAPKPEGLDKAEATSFVQFVSKYEELFGSSLPDVWFDERSVRPWRRIFNDQAGSLKVLDNGDSVDLIDSAGTSLLSVNQMAHSALVFISKHAAFYVRELPDDLADEEKVGLISALVEVNLLRVAS